MVYEALLKEGDGEAVPQDTGLADKLMVLCLALELAVRVGSSTASRRRSHVAGRKPWDRQEAHTLSLS